MLIGFDIDGIILDYERTMRSFAELYDLLILKKKGVVHKEEFEYLKRYDWTEEERRKFIDNYFIYATTHCTPLIPLVKEMIEILEKEGHRVVFITARGMLKKETIDAVLEVFKRNNLPTDNIYWQIKDKVSKCLELGVDVMIEDKPKTVKDLSDNNIKTLYFRDKGNEILPEGEYLTEVSNVGEIVRYIISLNGYNNDTEAYQKILIKE